MQSGLSKQTILVVDDDYANIDLLKRILKEEYRILYALDGQKAISIVNSNNKPDLILLDIIMPGTDGYDVCRQLKTNPSTRKIPVIFVTGDNEETGQSKGFEAGCVDYITKPVNPALLKARVKTHLTLYCQNRFLEDKVTQRTAQLQEAFYELKAASLDAIRRLSKTAEYKDEDTGAHIPRMSNYSAIVARKMGLDEKTVESILYASPLHDIGKIGIPDKILLKSGKLNADEWEIMKQHTENGAIILEGFNREFIKMGKMIALTHHEKWDGSGYPKGLKGEEIPLVGRIVAVADVFDALTSKRPFREPYSLEEAYAIIRNGSGSSFDPDVVDAFFSAKNEILSIKEKYKDSDESLFLKIAEMSSYN